MTDDGKSPPGWPNLAMKSVRPTRTLGVWLADLAAWVDERGKMHEPVTWEEVKYDLCTASACILTDSPSMWTWIDDAIQDKSCRVMCDNDGRINAIRVLYKRKTAWVVASASWCESDPLEAMETVRRVLNRCHAGDHITPSALGQALMIKHFPANELPQSGPHGLCRRMLRRGLIGGRVDTIRPGEMFRELLETDCNGAYLARSVKLPTGTSVKIHPSDYDRRKGDLTDRRDPWTCTEPAPPGDREYVASFWRCQVKIPIDAHLLLGPFGIPVNSDKKEIFIKNKIRTVAYPTQPGLYHTFLWDEEIELCREQGLEVELIEGWGWIRWTGCLKKWAEEMWRLRNEARGDKPAEAVIKKAALAALGRFAAAEESYTVGMPGDDTVGTWVRGDDDGITNYAINRKVGEGTCCMPHWYSYIMMQQRCVLYRKALPFARNGRLVGTNYDAVFLLPTRYEIGQTVEPNRKLGAWKWNSYTQAYIPYPRALIATKDGGGDTMILPGMARDGPERAALAAKIRRA